MANSNGKPIDLSHHTGSATFHATTIRGDRFLVTEGVLDLMEQAGAFWLADVIASYQGSSMDRASEGFQVWTLRKLPARAVNAAVVECWTDDPGANGSRRLVRQLIPYTDFPFDLVIDGITGDGTTITIWVEGTNEPGSRPVALLKSEH